MKKVHKDHCSKVAALGCVICKRLAAIHHAIGGSLKDLGIHHGKSQKNSHWLVIPLCHNHHQGAEGFHQIGVLTWEERYGTQVMHLNWVSEQVGYDVFEKARQEDVR